MGRSLREMSQVNLPQPPSIKPIGPRNRWMGPVTLTVLLLASWIATGRTGLPRPVPASAPDTAFSSARAMSTLIEIAREAHPTGSPEHARVRSFILDQLVELGLKPEVQTATSLVQASGIVRAGTMRNILGRLPGTDPTGTILITAHYDARELAPGASDDGSGVVAILEALRAVEAGDPLRNNVVVLITDGEEIGLLGARAFVDEHPWMEEVSLVLSFEMRGAGGPSIMFETAEENGWVVRALDAFAPNPNANSMTYEIYKRMPNDTDFTPFREAGKQGLNFAAIDHAHVYHQVYDVPDNLSEATLQHHGVHALGALKHFGRVELSDVDAPNVVYFSLPVLGLVIYERGWINVLSGALILLFLVAVVVLRRRGARLKGIAFSTGLSLVGIALAVVVGFGLLRAFPRFHPELGSLHGSALHSEGPYVIALGSTVFALVLSIGALGRRWLSSAELALGAVVLPMVGAGAVGFVTPLAAMNLQWPVMAALFSTILVARLEHEGEGMAGWIVTTLLMVPVLFVLVPVIELAWLALTIDLALVLAALMAVTTQLCLPALASLRHPNDWWAPTVGFVVGAVALGMGLGSSSPSAERPAPSTLVYAYEHGTDSAVWATEPTRSPLDAEALQWSVERAGGEFESRRDLSGFGYLRGTVPVTSAPVVSVPSPEVVIVSDSLAGLARRVRLRVRSRIGAEMMQFRYDGSGTTRLLSINGKGLAEPKELRWADHWGEPDGSVVLDLEVQLGAPIGLYIIEHMLRPAELLGDDTFARPTHLVPNVVWMSDRAMLRSSVARLVDPGQGIALSGPSTVPLQEGR